MPLNAFIIRPFGVKEVVAPSEETFRRVDALVKRRSGESLVGVREATADGKPRRIAIDFEAVDARLVAPALDLLRIQGETASAIVVAGNIREDMFHRLLTADVVIADLSIHNANVFYELGIRQAFRDKYTFLIRCNLSDYPFDLKTDRYFEYDLEELVDTPSAAVERLAKALRATVSSYKPDSPVFKLLPKLEAEDRSRFISVPEEFREEVERARRHQRPEHLRLLAVEVEGYLWEIEGLREIGRAQFESNFIDGAKVTWEEIVNRYPDDVEANTVLSTIYQRLGEITRSEQALARVSRVGSLTPSRLSQLRSLSGRNLKAAWTDDWRRVEGSPERRQQAALTSPLLHRACEAYEEAFKADLNNAYAGLNALTLLVIQAELAERWQDVWRSIQRDPVDADRELSGCRERIHRLVSALALAVESDRERLRREGAFDPWFSLLEAAVACIVSDQPEHVARLYHEAKYFAPLNAEQSMRRALEVYRDLDIRGRESANDPGVGTIGDNVARALSILSDQDDSRQQSQDLKRIVMFVGMRIDNTVQHTGSAAGTDERPCAAGERLPARRLGLAPECVEAARAAIRAAVEQECALGGRVLFGLAAGANGGDLLFHEVCRELGIPTRMCLALPRPQYIGQYVAPAGPEWVQRFQETYRLVRQSQDPRASESPFPGDAVPVFTDADELPRWLQGKLNYNAGRRNTLWMLQHAIVATGQLGENAEISLLALWDGETEGGIGGIGHLVKLATLAGVKVRRIPPPQPGESAEAPGVSATTGGSRPASRREARPVAAPPPSPLSGNGGAGLPQPV